MVQALHAHRPPSLPPSLFPSMHHRQVGEMPGFQFLPGGPVGCGGGGGRPQDKGGSREAMEGGRSQGPAKSFVTLFVPGGGRRQVHDEEAARGTSLRQGEWEGGGFEERDMGRPKFLLEGGGERGRGRPGKGSQEGRDDAFEKAAEPGKTDGGGLNKNTAGWRERGERKGGNDEKDRKV